MRLDELIDLGCRIGKVERADLMAGKKSTAAITVRFAIIWYAHDRLGLSYPALADALGRELSSVGHACREMRASLALPSPHNAERVRFARMGRRLSRAVELTAPIAVEPEPLPEPAPIALPRRPVPPPIARPVHITRATPLPPVAYECDPARRTARRA